MAGGEQASHRPGLLKQQNKSHKTGRHRSKSEIDKTNKGKQPPLALFRSLFSTSNLSPGRVQLKTITKRKNQELGREDRRRKANQLRSKKREDVLTKKRALGGNDTAPFLTAIIPLGETSNIKKLIKLLRECDPEIKIETTGCNVTHIK